MAHRQQREYCERIKKRFPQYFINQKVLDVGSLDINGSNRDLFVDCNYTGIDIGPGKNVDIVSLGHEFNDKDESYNVVISTECFEHDMYYEKTLKNIVRLLKSGGFFIFTCAGTGRPEHGTKRTSILDSPHTCAIEGWGDYYMNLNEEIVKEAIDIDLHFREYQFSFESSTKDLQFWGIKN